MIDQRPDAPETVIRMSYPRLYASADRETHFQAVPVSMTPVVYVQDLPDHPLVDVATAQAVTALTFSRLEAGFFGDWHPAPRRQFVVVLSGGIELTVSDGEKRTFGPGGVYRRTTIQRRGTCSVDSGMSASECNSTSHPPLFIRRCGRCQPDERMGGEPLKTGVYRGPVTGHRQ
jgi:hypothetical protein